jgi:hypothetical protein
MASEKNSEGVTLEFQSKNSMRYFFSKEILNFKKINTRVNVLLDDCLGFLKQSITFERMSNATPSEFELSS